MEQERIEAQLDILVASKNRETLVAVQGQCEPTTSARPTENEWYMRRKAQKQPIAREKGGEQAMPTCGAVEPVCPP